MLYDITQELFSCKVYPGDPAPRREVLQSIEAGAVCNLTALSLCAHNGTHVDAPFHFIPGGQTIDALGLEPFVGRCWLARHEGDVTAADAARMLDKARRAGAGERLLIAGAATVTEAGAAVFAQGGLKLLGNESQTFGPEDAPAAVHRLLLGAGLALLEGIVLAALPEGRYFLNAAPLNLAGGDGAPCRAWLLDGCAVRPIEARDDRRVGEIIRACLHEYDAPEDGCALADPDLDSFSRVYAPAGRAYWVAEDETGAVMGGVGIAPLDGVDGVCELQKMYCLPAFRGSGAAHRLLETALSFAARHYRRCYLETFANMVEAQKFYEKHGFTRMDEPLGDTGHFRCDVRYCKEL